MPKVIIVSNRLPISVSKTDGQLAFSPSIGGLATGLASYAEDRSNSWLGWPGISSDQLTAKDKQQIVQELAKHNCTPVFLSQRQLDDFYNGYSNSVLWPAFHNLARSGRVSSDQRRQWWQAYRKVNQEFAQAAINLVDAGSHVWIHDYQLMLVPDMLRAARPDAISGFFLHIPFPEPKIFNRAYEAKKLIVGMLGADLVGFHTAGYVNNFLDGCRSEGMLVSPTNEVSVDNRMVRVADFPMGIDYDKYAAASRLKSVKQAVRRYRRRYRRQKVIVAIDRLDPSKGLVERLQAYSILLKNHPRLRRRVVFVMVAAPSRTDVPVYKNLSKKLALLAEEINNNYGQSGWRPVDYINEVKPFEEVTALFQIADVAFIAPLRDGMNLAAKEFVASKRRSGVLILSQTAGAAEELSDALIVNPKDQASLVAALEQALAMRRRELKRRLKQMQRHLSTNTVQYWAKDFIKTLQTPLPGTELVRTVQGKVEKALVNDWTNSRKRLLLLDYDGSLVPLNPDYKSVKPPHNVLRVIEGLSSHKGTDVVLISGRSPSDLEERFGHLPINLVAEHGAAIKYLGRKSWQILDKSSSRWQADIRPILEKYIELTPGAKLEVKPHTLVWHYRAAQPFYAQKYAVTIKRVLKPILKAYGLELLQGNKILEIKNPQVSKGAAAQNWLKRDYEFVLGLGDDTTDEELFQILPRSAYSIKVGRGRTAARYRLASSHAVLQLLGKLV